MSARCGSSWFHLSWWDCPLRTRWRVRFINGSAVMNWKHLDTLVHYKNTRSTFTTHLIFHVVFTWTTSHFGLSFSFGTCTSDPLVYFVAESRQFFPSLLPASIHLIKLLSVLLIKSPSSPFCSPHFVPWLSVSCLWCFQLSPISHPSLVCNTAQKSFGPVFGPWYQYYSVIPTQYAGNQGRDWILGQALVPPNHTESGTLSSGKV